MHTFFTQITRKIVLAIILFTIFATAASAQLTIYDKQCDGRIRFDIGTYSKGNLLDNDYTNPAKLEYKDRNGNWIIIYTIYHDFNSSGGNIYPPYFTNRSVCYEERYVNDSITNGYNNVYFDQIAFNVQGAYNETINFRFTRKEEASYCAYCTPQRTYIYKEHYYSGISYGPNTPTNLKATMDQSCDKVSLTWDNPIMTDFTNCGGTFEVDIFRDGVSLATTTNNFYDDITAIKGFSHSYTILTHGKSKNAKQTTFNDTYSAPTPAVNGRRTGHLADPASVTAIIDKCYNVKLKWAWTTLPLPSSFGIFRSTSPTGKFVPVVESLSGSSTAYTDYPDTMGVKFYYQIKSKNVCLDYSSGSTSSTSITQNPAITPPKLQSVENNNGKVVLTFIGDNQLTNFKIYRNKKGEVSGEIKDLDKGITTYSDASVQPCIEYEYKIGSYNTPCSPWPNNNFSNIVSIITRADLGSDPLSDFQASKGYFQNYIGLTWKADLAKVKTFYIYRIESGDTNLLKVIDNTLSFEDRTALGGVLYKYKLVGYSDCNGKLSKLPELTDVGFYQPYGIVNGRVDYAGGNAVEGVRINFEPSSGIRGKSIDVSKGQYLSINSSATNTISNAFTAEVWAKTNTAQVLWSKLNNYGMEVQNVDNSKNDTSLITLKYYVYISDSGGARRREFIANNLVTGRNQWNHFAMSYGRDSLRIYFNGKKINSNFLKKGSLLSSTSPAEPFICGNTVSVPNSTFLMDEIRIWNVERSGALITRDYGRSLTGSEIGLIGYYRCDEGVKSPDVVYDCSKAGVKFNKNDARVKPLVGVTPLQYSDSIPSSNQFGASAYTDANGNYSAGYIPYRGGGESFVVTPSLGQHVFDPPSKNVYIGDGSQTLNNIDFKDNSSFDVTGTVTYFGGNLPVKDVVLYVDGKIAFGSDYKPVVTDSLGEYKLSVPIGYHYITVAKDNHVFSEGIYPKQVTKFNINKFEFKRELININFKDSTFIKVAGKVVGGGVEAAKPLWLGLTKNNIGSANITFTVQENYNYNINKGSKEITVKTNASGEYEVNLYPENWTVKELVIPKQPILLNDVDKPVIDLRNSFTKMRDSAIVISGKDSSYKYYTYQKKNNYIYYSPRIIKVNNTDGTEFYGENNLIVDNYTTHTKDIIDLTNKQLGYPLFQSTLVYTAKVGLFENYTNKDNPDEIVNDSIPVAKAEILVSNEFDLIAKVQGKPIVLKTDSSGYATYSFKAGMPNVDSDSILQNMHMYSLWLGEYAHWPAKGSDYKAFIIGSKPIPGTNFVTVGPQQVDIVLRDPPGSKSYAYIEKGSTFTQTRSFNLYLNSTSDISRKIAAGLGVSLGGGMIGPLIKNDYINDEINGFGLESSTNTNGDYVEKYTFTERFQTSSAIGDEGSMADLFIGKSNNVFFGKSKVLDILDTNFIKVHGLTTLKKSLRVTSKSNRGYQLALQDGFTMNPDSQKTFFVFSQDHIVNNLIPNLMELRNYVLLNNPKYDNHLPLTHRYFGMSNSDTAFFSSHFKDSISANHGDRLHMIYTFKNETGKEIDSVAFFNLSISNWLTNLQRNEEEKVNAAFVQNVSFDGVSGPHKSEIKETHTSSTQNGSKRNITYFSGGVIGNITNDELGVKLITNDKTTIGGDQSTGTGNAQELVFGYVLEDGDQGDYYSVDVKKSSHTPNIIPSSLLTIQPSPDLITASVFDIMGFGASQGQIRASSKFAGSKIIAKAVSAYFGKESYKSLAKGNAVVDAVAFAVNTGLQLYDMVQIGIKSYDVNEQINDNKTWDVSGFAISSPIFAVKGGQTKCPYSDGDSTSIYVNKLGLGYPLNEATIQRELPEIRVDKSIVNNVSAGSKAVFTLNLQNNSGSGSDAWYSLKIDDASNKNGAIVKIDGLDPNRDFFVPYGKPITKTLTIEIGKADVLNYDSIGVILHSRCEFDISSKTYVSAKFQPVCSSVAFKGVQDNWLVNSNNKNRLNFKIADYNLQNSKFSRIELEYKKPSDLDPLTKLAYYVADDTDYKAYNGTKELIKARSEIVCDWDVSSLPDQSYMIRLKTYCSDGSIYATPYLTGNLSRGAMQVFGSPSPANGILNTSDDISVQFNKPIEAGLIVRNTISIETVLNGTPVSHNVSVRMDGMASYASIPVGVDLNNKSFTIEFWAKRDNPSQKDVFFQQGSDFEIGFNSRTDLYWKTPTGTNTVTLDYPVEYPDNAWHHYAFVYNKDLKLLNMYMDEGAITGTDIHGFEKSNVSLTGLSAQPILIGKQVSGSTRFAGNIHDLRIWNQALTRSAVSSAMSHTLGGNELGLYGYWPMDAGMGTLAVDKARGRNMNLYAKWTIDNEGKSLQFDGSSVAAINSKDVVINNDNDMTLEFWFKAAMPTSEQCLFSHGIGNNSEKPYMDTSTCMSIYTNASGKIYVQANGKKFEAVSANYFNNQWHHFALVVSKRSNVKAFVDGVFQNVTDASAINSLYGTPMWLGAQVVMKNQMEGTKANFFKGNIDEVRIWKLSRTAEQLQIDMNHRLKGSEMGLMAYYPFEKFNTQTQEFDKDFADQSVASDSGNNAKYVKGANTLLLAEVPVTAESPAIQLARPVTELSPISGADYSYVIGADKIIISLNSSTKEKRARIENCVLNISVERVKDKSGNSLPSPVTWTAYVNRNPVRWKDTEYNGQKGPSDDLTFNEKIINTGGTPMNFELSNLPAWISASTTTGILAPNSELTITFTVNAGLNIGTYDEILYLSSDFGYKDVFGVQIKVKKNPPADWKLDPAKFTNSMNVISQLTINNIVSYDKDNIVAAFVNGECRGIASPEYFPQLDMYYTFINIYSNADNGETIEFRVWDNSQGLIRSHVTASPNFTFTANTIKGSTNNPVVINADNALRVDQILNKGWSWISFNIASANMNNVDAFLKDINVNGNRIQYQNAFSQYESITSRWTGNLTTNDSITNERMYKLFLQRGDTLFQEGEPVIPSEHPIAIGSGWNWISYLPMTNMKPLEALSSLNPVAGDLLKSQSAFAIYDNNLGWIGTLKVMEPNKGYMFQAGKAGVITYPNKGTFENNKREESTMDNISLDKKINIAVNDYASNMTVIAEVEPKYQSLLSGNEILLANTKAVLKGAVAAEKIPGHGNLYFLTLYGNLQAENISFNLLDNNLQKTIIVENKLSFSDNATMGSLENPYMLRLSDYTDNTSTSETVSVFPNPFTGIVQIGLTNTDKEVANVTVTNSLGAKLFTKEVSSKGGSLDCTEFPAGIYFFNVKSNNSSEVFRLVKH